MTDSHYLVYLNAVHGWANSFHRDLFPSGAPCDPFLLASHLGVSVQEIDLKGVDGYVESFKGDYRVFLSSLAPFVRRRFTLSHELAHVISCEQQKEEESRTLTSFAIAEMDCLPPNFRMKKRNASAMLLLKNSYCRPRYSASAVFPPIFVRARSSESQASSESPCMRRQ